MPSRRRARRKSAKFSKANKPKPFSVRKATPESIAKQLALQKAREKQIRLDKAAKAATRRYRASKSDRGKLVFIGLKGQKNPASKGRKGWLIYVDKKGKKKLVRSKGNIPTKINNVKIPFLKKYNKAKAEFESARLVKVGRGKATRPAVRGKGKINTGTGAYDFNEVVVRKIARSVQTALSRVKSHRIFLVKVNILVRLQDGSQRSLSFQVPIARPDHVAIQLGGVENWVRKLFYANMANQLRFAGLVSSGSANHIRRLSENKEAEKGEYTKDGVEWEGNELEIAKILVIEWQIEQSS